MRRITCAVLLLAGWFPTTVSFSKDPLPNIVFILSDDQGWNDIGYHNPEIRTPNLDRLAEEGIELDCHYVQPQCTPTRVALMTGRYPSRFGTHCVTASNERSYERGTLTLASMLKTLGYETAISGKWHMGSLPEWGPNHYGFDHSYGSFAGAVGMYDHRYRLNQPDYTQTWHRNHEFVEEVGHATDLVTQEAVEWIEREKEGPFFLYVPFHSVHTPLVEEVKWIAINNHIDDPERRLYAAAVTHMDYCIGQMVEALDRSGQRENTLVVFSSDNGAQINHSGNNYPPPDVPLTDFSSNDPLRGKKSQAYEGGFRVPALVNWPGTLEPGKIDSPMHVVDWMPTFAARLGYKPDEDLGWDGENLWPLLSGEESKSTERVIYTTWGRHREWEALRHGDWKIVRNNPKDGDADWELYDLIRDPTERTNLADSQPEKLAELLQLFHREKQKDAI